jgi:hypothetical protein
MVILIILVQDIIIIWVPALGLVLIIIWVMDLETVIIIIIMVDLVEDIITEVVIMDIVKRSISFK